MRSSKDRMAAVVEILAQRHPLFARATIERWVATAFAAYSSAPVQAYVPILAQREIDARLHELEADVPVPGSAASAANGRTWDPVRSSPTRRVSAP